MRRLVAMAFISFTLSACGDSSGGGDARPGETGQGAAVIGAVLPMTGAAAQYGSEAREGIEIAVEVLAERHTGTDFQLAIEDSESSARVATSALAALRSQHQGLPAFLSEVSGVVLALAPIAARDSIVQVNVGAQNPDIADAGPFTFSIINLANIESRRIARYAAEVLGAQRAAVLFADASYGEGARLEFADEFRALGGQVVAEVRYGVEDPDYRAQLREVAAADPEVVYLPGTTQDMARVLRQSSEMGFQPQWLSYTSFEGPELLRIAGDAANGVIFTSHSFDWSGAEGVQAEFRDAYQQRYGRLPSVYSATAFDGTMLIASALAEGARTGPEIREFFLGQPGFAGATGRTVFDAAGTVDKPLIFKVIRDGTPVVAEAQLQER